MTLYTIQLFISVIVVLLSIFHVSVTKEMLNLHSSFSSLIERFLYCKITFPEDRSEEQDANFYAAKEQKTLFLKKLIDLTQAALKTEIDVKPGKILAGAEAHTVDLYGDGLLSIESPSRSPPRRPARTASQ